MNIQSDFVISNVACIGPHRESKYGDVRMPWKRLNMLEHLIIVSCYLTLIMTARFHINIVKLNMQNLHLYYLTILLSTIIM